MGKKYKTKRNEGYYTVGEIVSLGLMMGRNGPLKDKAGVLRQVRNMEHRTILKNRQRIYVVSLASILAYNARKQRRASITLI